MQLRLSALLIFFMAFSTFGQTKLDSLKSIDLSKLRVEDRLEVISNILRFNSTIVNSDSAMRYANMMLEYSAGTYYKREADAYAYLGQVYVDRGDHQTGLYYLLKAKEAGNQTDYRNGAWFDTLLASLYGKLGDLENMRSTYMQSIDYYKNKPNEYGVAGNFNGLGEGYFLNKAYDSALHYYMMALDLAKTLQYDPYIRLFSGNIGMTYNKLGRYQEAAEILEETVEQYSRTEDVNPHAIFLFQLGETYMNLGLMQTGLSKSGETLEVGFNPSLVAEIANNRSARMLDYNMLSRAEEALRKSLQMGQQNDFLTVIRDASLLLSQLYQIEQKFQLGLDLYQQYHTYKDSVENIENVKSIANMRRKYEVSQKQAEVDLLSQEKKRQEFIIMATGCFALLLLIFGVIISKFYTDKAKINAELVTLNATKDKLFSIISHDLRGPVNSFASVSGLIKYLVKADAKDDLIEMADDIHETVEGISALLDGLLEWAMQQQGQFPFDPETINLKAKSDEVIASLLVIAKGKNIDLKSEVEESIAIYADDNSVTTLLRNLVSNALKFTPEGGKVSIHAKSNSQVVIIGISDTGIGIPKSKIRTLFQLQQGKKSYGTAGEKGLGLGLQLVKEFVTLNRGTIKVESEENKGTTFTVTLPAGDNGEKA
ncbi:MAG: hypothetical protein JXR10_00380 [Cyclobacteriaceae bacterium]